MAPISRVPVEIVNPSVLRTPGCTTLLEQAGCGDCLYVSETEVIGEQVRNQDELYRATAAEYEAALNRLAHAYEPDPEKRRDLLQDIHLQLWRSLPSFEGRCTLRTWVYRVAHNTATSHVIRERRRWSRLASIEELESVAGGDQVEPAVDRRMILQRISQLIQQLKPIDRQVMLCWLEDMDAVTIGEITGLSPANIGMKVHRLRGLLARRFHEGGRHAE